MPKGSYAEVIRGPAQRGGRACVFDWRRDGEASKSPCVGKQCCSFKNCWPEDWRCRYSEDNRSWPACRTWAGKCCRILLISGNWRPAIWSDYAVNWPTFRLQRAAGPDRRAGQPETIYPKSATSRGYRCQKAGRRIDADHHDRRPRVHSHCKFGRYGSGAGRYPGACRGKIVFRQC